MDSSSEDSFTWCKEVNSDDNDSDSNSTINASQNGYGDLTPKKRQLKDQSGTMEESILKSDKAKKRKIIQNNDSESEDYKSPKKKKGKTEDISENIESNKYKERIIFEKSDSESYLNMKVKSEELSTSETSYSKPKKKKHKKSKESLDIDEDYLHLAAEQENSKNVEPFLNDSVKKKKGNTWEMKNESLEADESFLDSKVKEEPDLSDTTPVKLKKKKKSKLSGNMVDEQNIDEEYLNLKVKEENINTPTKANIKKKKKSISLGNQDYDIDYSLNENKMESTVNTLETEIALETETVKKSKKKSKKDKQKQLQEKDNFSQSETDPVESNRFKDKLQKTTEHKRNKTSYNSTTDEENHIDSSQHTIKSPSLEKETISYTVTRTNNRHEDSDEESDGYSKNNSSTEINEKSPKELPHKTSEKYNKNRSIREKENSPISPAKTNQVNKNNLRTTISNSDSSNEDSNKESKDKSPQSKLQTSNNISRRTISTSSDSSSKDSGIKVKDKSKSLDINKHSNQNISRRTISTSSSSDDDIPDKNKTLSAPASKSPQVNKQPNNTSRRTVSTSRRTVSTSSDTSTEDTPNSTNPPTVQSKTKTKNKISDRIMYEEDESDTESQNLEVSSSRLKHFLKTNNNLHRLMKKPISDSIITDEDDIWILKCPHDINVKTLKDSEFVLDKKCKFKMNGKTYHGTVDNSIEKMAITSYDQNKFVIKNLSLNGVIHVKKRIPKQHIQDDSTLIESHNNFIPLPETKCRHPFFGANFKQAMKIPKHIARTLKDVQTTELTSPEEDKRERKKNRKRLRESLKEEPVEDVVTEQELVSYERKESKKQKHDDTEVPAKKAKRKRLDDSSEVWDSEKAIEENLFNY